MKRVFVSQRVTVAQDYGERRDALDQSWARFLLFCGALCCPLPNHAETVRVLLRRQPPDGILLTGGNSPAAYDGNAPERDAVDELLLDYARSERTPLIGVCRGMQSIVLHFGGRLEAAQGHVAARHPLQGRISGEANSYHTLAAKSVPSGLALVAQSPDGVIEAAAHRELPILGIMWHPERETPYRREGIALFARLYESGGMP